MPQRRRPRERKPEPLLTPQAKRELGAVFFLTLSALALFSLVGMAGPMGRTLNDGLASVFGLTKAIVPLVLLAVAGRIAFPGKFSVRAPAALGAFLFLASISALFNLLLVPKKDDLLYVEKLGDAGGYFGLLLAWPLLSSVGAVAGVAVLLLLFFVSAVLTFNISLSSLVGSFTALLRTAIALLPKRRSSDATSANQHSEPIFTSRPVADYGPAPETIRMSPQEAEAAAMTAAVKRKHRSRPISIPLDLLEHKTNKPTAGDIHGRMLAIRKTLENFGIPVEMGEVSVGPTVTQFTLKPSDGVRLASITALSNDLALALAAHPIRIEAPIPGKSLVGIEVPNQTVAIVGLREVLGSKEFSSRGSNLTFCLGKDVSGTPWIADLGKMPHMLVAGATGSGKTVCLNALILSLLYQNSPDDLKLMLIDPKRVELPIYNGIPHLLTPVITEVPKIVNALKWTIQEMDRRFDLLSKAGKRDIASYNEEAEEKMPFIVIIIDELADLMFASAAEVEGAIIRIAQMARAVGIHLIVATQRPSVDVVTGLIKANITSRLAFSVGSSVDSRTILDTTGAEKLVGRGDMLYMTAEVSKPKRIQCCYVGDKDIRRVVDFIVSQLDEPVAYAEGVTEKRAGGFDASQGMRGDGDDDELLDEAKTTVVRAGKASASYLQRRLKIGYARAARILDLLEERGIIGPGDGAKPRQVLISPIDGEAPMGKDEMM